MPRFQARRWSRRAAAFGRRLVDVVFPPRCLHCGDDLLPNDDGSCAPCCCATLVAE